MSSFHETDGCSKRPAKALTHLDASRLDLSFPLEWRESSMSSPHGYDPSIRIRNGGARDVLLTSVLGIFLMMVLTTWWWHAMR